MTRLTPCYMLGLLVILIAPVVALYLRHGNAAYLPVTSPSWIPPAASTDTLADSNWHVEYFTSTTLIERCYDGYESSVYIFKQWESAAPAAGCPGDNFSARFTALVNFLEGDFRFHLEHDDGARLYVDGEAVIDAWSDGSAGHDAPARALLSGMHEISVEYYSAGGFAALGAWWYGPGALPEAPVHNPDLWLAEYYGNNTLWGRAALVQNEGTGVLTHTWGTGGPGNGLPPVDFSARFERDVLFECGRYRFDVHADDGVRLWVGDTQILDAWDGQAGGYTPEADVITGSQTVSITYFNAGGSAALAVDWEMISPCLQPPLAPAPNWPVEGSFYVEQEDIQLKWARPDSATDYRAHLWGAPDVDLYSGWQPTTTWDIGAQPAGYVYQWQVQARNSAGASGWSITRTFTVKPAPPEDLSAQATACNQVSLTWSDQSSHEDGYRIYRDGVNAGQANADSTGFQDDGLNGDTTYTYAVKAYRGSIESADSNTALVTTPECPPLLPDLRPFAPPGHAAALVPSAVKHTHITSTLYASKPAYFDWHFANRGNAAASTPFHVELWIDNELRLRQPYSSIVTDGESGMEDWMSTVTGTGPHQVKLILDPDNTIAESDETNNIWTDSYDWQPLARWWGEYYNNETLSGDPALVRAETDVNYEWENNSPGPGVQSDHFSARWTGRFTMVSGIYHVYIYRDDGARLFVDGVKVFDKWEFGSEDHIVDIAFTSGAHDIRFETYEIEGWAGAWLWWYHAGGEHSAYVPIVAE